MCTFVPVWRVQRCPANLFTPKFPRAPLPACFGSPTALSTMHNHAIVPSKKQPEAHAGSKSRTATRLLSGHQRRRHLHAGTYDIHKHKHEHTVYIPQKGVSMVNKRASRQQCHGQANVGLGLTSRQKPVTRPDRRDGIQTG